MIAGELSTGLPALDRVLGRLRAGDNVVWEIDRIEDYAHLVRPLVEAALAAGRRVVYFRFARHAELVPAGRGVLVHRLDPGVGFEGFTAAIHDVIDECGRGTFYVFDCLSDLAADWYSDLMLGNFFLVTCPRLYELETVTYFALFRDHHSHETIEAIRSTTQILVDVLHHEHSLYVHPRKVDGRHSPTMYLPHLWGGSKMEPLTASAVVAQVLVALARRRDEAARDRADPWKRRFRDAREVLEGIRAGKRPPTDADAPARQLLRMMVTRDERLAELAARHLDLSDLIAIRRRMIGTGLVGGKAAGILLARAILTKANADWSGRLEPHDSWFVGSDVFYTYLVRNGCWPARRAQRSRSSYLDGAAEARRRVFEGHFPPFVEQRFVTMLEYYGQSPIIVRSSSLLEDSFGNAFTGKYDSVFCPNQGSPAERLTELLAAVKSVYASTMSEEALRYRERRGLLERDEQMAIVVQRVSGAVYGDLFYPQVAGVALSHNPYVWCDAISADAGVVRLVFGLGTRAVDHADDDYTRIVALNAPLRRPEASEREVLEHSQRRVDFLDLGRNSLASAPLDEVLRRSPRLPVSLFTSARRDAPMARPGWRGAEGKGPGALLSFDMLLSATSLVPDMREMLAILRDAYRYPVDVEFTANFLEDGRLYVNLVQCRPLQVKEGGVITPPPADLAPSSVLLSSPGPVVGQSSNTVVDRVVYVDPDPYSVLPTQDRYEVARVIGRLMRLRQGDPPPRVLLLGPGRWGTTTVSLGVPVAFAEIHAVSALCEIATMGMNVPPDLSLGSHFFNDLVETNMLYLALYPNRAGHVLQEERLRGAPNRLPQLLPDDARMASVLRVVDFPLAGDGRRLRLNANCVKQQVVCYLEAPA